MVAQKEQNIRFSHSVPRVLSMMLPSKLDLSYYANALSNAGATITGLTGMCENESLTQKWQHCGNVQHIHKYLTQT